MAIGDKRTMHLHCLLVTVLCLLAACGTGVQAYLPGIAERTYNVSDAVDVRVNTLRSLSTLLPYNYYHLPFCKPPVIAQKEETLGEVLWGDRVMSSVYRLQMQVNVTCALVPCVNREKNNEEVWANVDLLEKFINEGYRAGMSIDNLPIYLNQTKNPIFNGRCVGDVPAEQRLRYARGYAIGVHKNCNGQTLLNNHLHFNVQYHEVPAGGGFGDSAGTDGPRYSVVGFTGVAHSYRHAADGSSCNELFNPRDQEAVPLSTADLRQKVPVWWSYSVNWIRNDKVTWGTRWDAYLSTSFADSNPQIHWIHIVTSIAVTLSLSTIAFTVLMRALSHDFQRYNMRDPESQEEETGWKLVHADVFRPPPQGQLLAGLVGNGVQLVLMSGTILLFSLLGMLSPASRGLLLTTLVFFFALFSFASGFVCGHILKLFDRREWKWAILCGSFFPTVVYCVFFVTNLINFSAKATTAVPFPQFFILFLMWFAICIPLTVLGAGTAFRQEPLAISTKVGRLAREIPPQPWYVINIFIYAVAPLLPLGAAFLELKFILGSIWLNMVYYVFGFLTIVCMLWTATVVLTTLIAVYYRLCYENYEWWWASFATPACYGAHVFLYGIMFYFSELHIETTAGMALYFAYMGVFSLGYGLAAGAIGSIASFFFVRTIYGSIKID